MPQLWAMVGHTGPVWGASMVGSAITFGEYLTGYYLPTRPLADGSAKQLAVAAGLCTVPLVEITERQLAERLKAHARTHAAATTNSRRRALLTLWRAAADDGLTSPPRARLIPTQPEPRRTPQAWRASEVSRILEAAGLPQPDKPFHKFRASNASYTEAGGGDAQQQLGHSSRAVTQRYLDPRITRARRDVLPELDI